MIDFCNGNIFDSKCQVLVNPVNVVGVMGKGLAAQFKTRYPEMFVEYKKACKEGKIDIGKPYFWKDSILCFPTKRHWKDNSRLEYIESGLSWFHSNYVGLGISSIAFPKLGCGLGQLKWDDVKPLMLQYLQSLPIRVEIYV